MVRHPLFLRSWQMTKKHLPCSFFFHEKTVTFNNLSAHYYNLCSFGPPEKNRMSRDYECERLSVPAQPASLTNHYTRSPVENSFQLDWAKNKKHTHVSLLHTPLLCYSRSRSASTHNLFLQHTSLQSPHYRRKHLAGRLHFPVHNHFLYLIFGGGRERRRLILTNCVP